MLLSYYTITNTKNLAPKGKGEKEQIMKKTKETTNYADLNTIFVSGTVTFNNRITEGVANVGIKCNYHLETIDKDFTTYPVIKVFNNGKFEVEDIERVI